MSFTGANMLMYFNFLAIATIGFAILGGFLKGFFKTTYYFVVTLIVFVGGFIAMPFITSYLMEADLSFFNQYIPASLEIELTTIKETVVRYLIEMNPSLEAVLVEESDALRLVFGVTQMALNLVYILVLYVFNLTIFKLIGFVIYLFIKPSKKDKYGNKRSKKRLLGALMGGLRGVFAVILLAIPFSGIVSIGNSASYLIEQQDAYPVMMTPEGYGFVSYSEEIESAELIEFLEGYRDTYVGQIASFIKVDDVALDEFVFDAFFSVKATSNGKEVSVKFRKELDNIAKLYEKLMTLNDGSSQFDEAFLKKLSEDDVNEILNYIESLDLIKVIIPVSVEYFIRSGEFDDMIEGYEDLITVEKLKQIDLVNDIKGLSPIFTDLISLLNEDTSIDDLNFLTLDGITVKRVFTNIGELSVVNQLVPVLFNWFVNSDTMTDLLTKYDLTKEDIVVPTAETLQNDFVNLGDLYIAFQALGFSDASQFEQLSDPLVIDTIADEALSQFIQILFSFELLSDNQTVLTEIMYDYMIEVLPVEYQQVFLKTDISSNFNATEMTNLVLLSKLLLSAGIVSEEFSYEDLLTEENINKLASRMSESNLLSSKMDDLLGILTDQFSLPFVLEIPAETTFSGETGKEEIKGLLNSIRIILDQGILEETFDFSQLTNETIDELSIHLTSSSVINHNLKSIIEQVISNTGFDFSVSLDDVVFDQTEISSLLKSVKIIIENGSSLDAITSLNASDINTLSQSLVITNTLKDELITLTSENGALYEVLYIPENVTWHSTLTNVGEVESFLLAIQMLNITGGLDQVSLDIDQILDKDIDQLFRSRIIEETSVRLLKDLVETGALSLYLEPLDTQNQPYQWYKTSPNGSSDAISLIESIQQLNSIGIAYDAFNYQAVLNALQAPQNIIVLENALLDSTILESSLEKMLNRLLITEAGFNVVINTNDDENYFKGTPENEGELHRLLNGLVSANELMNFDYLTLSSANKTVFKSNLNQINESEILRQLLVELLDSSLLDSVSNYKVSPRPQLTKAMWTSEIDALVDLFVLFNEGLNLSTLDITTLDDQSADNLGQSINLLSSSYLLDVNQIKPVIKSGFETVFSTTLSPLGEVSSPTDSYQDKVQKWADESSKLVSLIKQFDEITPISEGRIKGNFVGDTLFAETLGGFLDEAENSSMLNPIVIELAYGILDPSYHAYVDTTNQTYEEIMVQIHGLMWL
ncbi:MAG: hypothetical protein RBQ95_02675 [Paracholeplasma sp.]|nr:hypothetical protein [Paracholeplasma sp.]MDY3195741.1 hypothetical protein [Paracholeplasma sp.]